MRERTVALPVPRHHRRELEEYFHLPELWGRTSPKGEWSAPASSDDERDRCFVQPLAKTYTMSGSHCADGPAGGPIPSSRTLFGDRGQYSEDRKSNVVALVARKVKTGALQSGEKRPGRLRRYRPRDLRITISDPSNSPAPERQPAPRVLSSCDTYGLGARITLCVRENGEFHRGLDELQINRRAAQNRQVSAAKGVRPRTPPQCPKQLPILLFRGSYRKYGERKTRTLPPRARRKFEIYVMQFNGRGESET